MVRQGKISSPELILVTRCHYCRGKGFPYLVWLPLFQWCSAVVQLPSPRVWLPSLESQVQTQVAEVVATQAWVADMVAAQAGVADVVATQAWVADVVAAQARVADMVATQAQAADVWPWNKKKTSKFIWKHWINLRIIFIPEKWKWKTCNCPSVCAVDSPRKLEPRILIVDGELRGQWPWVLPV